MTFLTIFGVTEILCCFKLALEGKTGKEITESSRLELLEKFSANNSALSDAEDSTFGPLNRGGIADLPLLRTLLAIHHKPRQPSFWEVMDSYFISICKFGSFKNPFATITSLFELYFRSRRFILLVQTKDQPQRGQGLRILTPNQKLCKLPITLAQLKAGNNSEKT